MLNSDPINEDVGYLILRVGAGGANAFDGLRVDRLHSLGKQLGQNARRVDPQGEHAQHHHHHGQAAATHAPTRWRDGATAPG